MICSFTGRYNFLSNFYPCSIYHCGIRYPSVEHAYQAAKTFDKKMRKKIARFRTAGAAKKAGRLVELRKDWEDIKLHVMNALLLEKFHDKELAQRLIDTGDQELVEGNTWGDKYWGKCDGEGENHLGKLLMRVRQYLTMTETKNDR